MFPEKNFCRFVKYRCCLILQQVGGWRKMVHVKSKKNRLFERFFQNVNTIHIEIQGIPSFLANFVETPGFDNFFVKFVKFFRKFEQNLNKVHLKLSQNSKNVKRVMFLYFLQQKKQERFNLLKLASEGKLSKSFTGILFS